MSRGGKITEFIIDGKIINSVKDDYLLYDYQCSICGDYFKNKNDLCNCKAELENGKIHAATICKECFFKNFNCDED